MWIYIAHKKHYSQKKINCEIYLLKQLPSIAYISYSKLNSVQFLIHFQYVQTKTDDIVVNNNFYAVTKVWQSMQYAIQQLKQLVDLL